MEESKKNKLMAAIIVCCLIVAGIIGYVSFFNKGDSGISNFKGQLVWLKCISPDCGEDYQFDKRDYYEFIQKNQISPVETPALTCQKCDKETAYIAIKCEKCGVVFYPNSAGRSDWKDRCPKCKYSRMEEQKAAATHK